MRESCGTGDIESRLGARGRRAREQSAMAPQDWSPYGWSDDEGKRVGEPWHFRYVGGYEPRPDPLRFLTSTERGWIDELQRTHDPRRKRALRNKIRLQLNVIAREARKTGWAKRQRRKRFALLRRYI
jgi:hypothetical protein